MQNVKISNENIVKNSINIQYLYTKKIKSYMQNILKRVVSS